MGGTDRPSVSALTVFDDGGGPALYAGGSFTTAGGISANRIAKWDGTSWSALGTGLGGWVRALTVFDDGGGPALYAGGDFTTAGGVDANYIAKWDGASWAPLSTGMGGTIGFPGVYALAVFDDDGGPALYAGGGFTTAGDNVSAYFAKWSCPRRRGDMNENAAIDLDDYFMFFDCFAGPGLTVSDPVCGPSDSQLERPY